MSDADSMPEGGPPDAQDVDVASAIVDLQLQQVAYEASLGAAAKVIQPSLRDFLR